MTRMLVDSVWNAFEAMCVAEWWESSRIENSDSRTAVGKAIDPGLLRSGSGRYIGTFKQGHSFVKQPLSDRTIDSR